MELPINRNRYAKIAIQYDKYHNRKQKSLKNINQKTIVGVEEGTGKLGKNDSKVSNILSRDEKSEKIIQRN